MRVRLPSRWLPVVLLSVSLPFVACLPEPEPLPPTLRVSPRTLSFRVTYPGYHERTLRFSNAGGFELNVKLEMQHDDEETVTNFSSDGPWAFSLKTGEHREIQVRYTPAAVGEHEQTITVTSNDAENPVMEVHLTGLASTQPAPDGGDWEDPDGGEVWDGGGDPWADGGNGGLPDGGEPPDGGEIPDGGEPDAGEEEPVDPVVRQCVPFLGTGVRTDQGETEELVRGVAVVKLPNETLVAWATDNAIRARSLNDLHRPEGPVRTLYVEPEVGEAHQTTLQQLAVASRPDGATLLWRRRYIANGLQRLTRMDLTSNVAGTAQVVDDQVELFRVATASGPHGAAMLWHRAPRQGGDASIQAVREGGLSPFERHAPALPVADTRGHSMVSSGSFLLVGWDQLTQISGSASVRHIHGGALDTYGDLIAGSVRRLSFSGQANQDPVIVTTTAGPAVAFLQQAANGNLNAVVTRLQANLSPVASQTTLGVVRPAGVSQGGSLAAAGLARTVAVAYTELTASGTSRRITINGIDRQTGQVFSPVRLGPQDLVTTAPIAMVSTGNGFLVAYVDRVNDRMTVWLTPVHCGVGGG